MIKGNGIDIVEIERIERALEKNSRFLERIFSIKEREYIVSKNYNVNTIAGLFAAKEAVSKCIGTGVRGFKWIDIEINHDSFGKPYVTLKNNARRIAIDNGITNIHISISHSDKNAIAFAIGEGN